MTQLYIKQLFSILLFTSSLGASLHLSCATSKQPTLEAPLGSLAGTLNNTSIIISSAGDICFGVLKLAAVGGTIYGSYKAYKYFNPTTTINSKKDFNDEKLLKSASTVDDSLDVQAKLAQELADSQRSTTTLFENINNGTSTLLVNVRVLSSTIKKCKKSVTATATATRELSDTMHEGFSSLGKQLDNNHNELMTLIALSQKNQGALTQRNSNRTKKRMPLPIPE